MNPYDYLRPLLFRLDPERAHNRTLALLARMPVFMPRGTGGKPVELMGLTFPNRLGLAAGLDKNGVAVSAFDRAGFGFIEVGTVTPRPQPGNPRPRLFRLPEFDAIINRMGFNNLGIDALTARLAATPKPRALLGINLGKNKDTPNEAALDDYRVGLQKAWAHADYLAINISSPNTAGLRDLQHGAALRDLLAGIKAEQQRLADETARRVPIVVKIAPDLDDVALHATLDTIAEANMDGIIATNTTIDKSSLGSHPLAGEQGGLSGLPVREKSNQVLKMLAEHIDGKLPIIGVGGIMNSKDAAEKIRLGATAVQVYSGMIYKGPALVKDCLAALK